MFLLCHLGFALALLLFPLREFLHLRALAAGIAASFLLGVVTSTLGLATTAHSFRVCQGTQRTIAYALVSSIQTMGSGLSGFALAAVIEHMGRATGGNPFDTMLLGLGVLVVVQIAGLGLLRGSSIRMEEEVVPVPVSRGGSSDEELEISTT